MLRTTLISTRCFFPNVSKSFALPKNNSYRFYNRNSQRGDSSHKYQAYIKDKVSKTTGEGAFQFGKGALAGAALIGMGALCYYGSGVSSEKNTFNNSILWPQHVRERIHATYGYFGGSLAITTMGALAAARSPTIMKFFMQGKITTMIASFALMIGTGMVTRAIEYRPGIGLKQLAWAIHCGVIGITLAPLCILGGAILTRAAWYTAGVVGGLSMVAVCAPNDKFLYMGGALGAGLGVVFASSLASMFFPPTGALGAGLASISIYGGLILFSGFILFDTQRIVRKAENYPLFIVYDPIEACMSLYMDTLNIFIRIATILAGGNSRRK